MKSSHISITLVLFMLLSIKLANAEEAINHNAQNMSPTEEKSFWTTGWYLSLGGGMSLSNRLNTYLIEPKHTPGINGVNKDGYKKLQPTLSYLGRLAIGKIIFEEKFDNKLRGEIEYIYYRTKINKNAQADIKNTEPLQMKVNYKIISHSVFLNMQYNLPKNYITPYITLGLGRSYNDLSTLRITSDDSLLFSLKGKRNQQLAWSAGLGMLYKIKDKCDVDLKYKYVNLGKLDSEEQIIPNGNTPPFKGKQMISNQLTTHTITLGIIVYS